MSHTNKITDMDSSFVIDPIKRTITSNSPYPIMLVQYDHNSERFTFELPRYIDGHDMLESNLVQVHYANISKDGKTKVFDIYTVEDLDVVDDTVVFTWLISGNATQYIGTLDFSIRFSCTTGEIVDYAWNTALFKDIPVLEALYNSDTIIRQEVDAILALRKSLQMSGSGENSTMFAGAECADGDNSIAAGADAKAISDDAISLGNNTSAGVKGYYIKAIDFNHRNIYLSKIKERAPTIITDSVPLSGTIHKWGYETAIDSILGKALVRGKATIVADGNNYTGDGRILGQYVVELNRGSAYLSINTDTNTIMRVSHAHDYSYDVHISYQYTTDNGKVVSNDWWLRDAEDKFVDEILVKHLTGQTINGKVDYKICLYDAKYDHTIELKPMGIDITNRYVVCQETLSGNRPLYFAIDNIYTHVQLLSRYPHNYQSIVASYVATADDYIDTTFESPEYSCAMRGDIKYSNLSDDLFNSLISGSADILVDEVLYKYSKISDVCDVGGYDGDYGYYYDITYVAESGNICKLRVGEYEHSGGSDEDFYWYTAVEILTDFEVTPYIQVVDLLKANYLSIISGYHYPLCGKIMSVDYNKITYDGDLGFTEFGNTDLTQTYGHLFYVPDNPKLGLVDVGEGAVALGVGNYASAKCAFAAGSHNLVGGNYGAVFGRDNKVGYAGLVSGASNKQTDIAGTCFGVTNTNHGYISHTRGRNNVIPQGAEYAMVDGTNNKVGGKNNHVDGTDNTITSGENNRISGKNNNITAGKVNSVDGTLNKVHDGNYNDVSGRSNEVTGSDNHVEGHDHTVVAPTVSAGRNHVEGYLNKVYSKNSHIQGVANESRKLDDNGTEVTNIDITGYHNIGNGSHQFVGGKYNSPKSNRARITGGGTSDSKRKNIEELDWKGNLTLAGDLFLYGNSAGIDERVTYLEENMPCLIAGTQILMADGSTKAIEDIQEGEMIKSWDIDNKTYIDVRCFGRVRTGIGKNWKVIVFDNDKSLTVFQSHPVFCTRHGCPWATKLWKVGIGNFGIDSEGNEIEYFGSFDRKDTIYTERYTLISENNLYFADGVLCGHNSDEKNFYRLKGTFTATEEEAALYEAEQAIYMTYRNWKVDTDLMAKTVRLRAKLAKVERQIALRKTDLSNADYKTVKYNQGVLPEEEWAAVISECEGWRAEINSQEEIAKQLSEQIAEIESSHKSKHTRLGECFKECYDMDMEYIKNRNNA